jgi:hypothetical protein
VRIGLVVDGRAEFASLGALYPELKRLTGHEFIGVRKADLQPFAPIGTIAKQCEATLRELFARRADRVVVLLDRETRNECPGALAAAVRQRLLSHGDVLVVLKDRAYENWLLADLDALRASPARFDVSEATRKRIEPNKADAADGVILIKRCINDGHYEKVNDSKRILESAEVWRMAAHSRSFRRFLRCVECPGYREQSRLPLLQAI